MRTSLESDVCSSDLPYRHAPDHQGQGLAAGNAAHAGNNRHQHCKGNHLLDGFFKHTNHRGRGEGGKYVDSQPDGPAASRSEEHTSELQSRPHLVCRLLLEKKKTKENLHVTEAH